MRPSRSIGKEPSFSRLILYSAILHFLFIFLVVIPIRTKQEDFRSYRVTLVGPIQTPRSLTNMKESAAATQAVKPLPRADMSLESVKEVAKEIERLRALKDLKESATKQEALSKKIQEIQIGKRTSSDKILPGAGTPGTGTGKGTDLYYSIISRKIWQQWIYPDMNVSGLEVIISIKIDRSGKVISHEIEKSSGNALFDRSAIRAISKASPLPPPHGEMEIGVRFYL